MCLTERSLDLVSRLLRYVMFYRSREPQVVL
jgi:hypothetical protein